MTEYPRQGDGWRKAGWAALFTVIGLVVLGIAVGSAAAVYRLVTSA